MEVALVFVFICGVVAYFCLQSMSSGVEKICQGCGAKSKWYGEKEICTQCETSIRLSLESMERVIGQSVNIIINSKNLDTVISRYSVIVGMESEYRGLVGKIGSNQSSTATISAIDCSHELLVTAFENFIKSTNSEMDLKTSYKDKKKIVEKAIQKMVKAKSSISCELPQIDHTINFLTPYKFLCEFYGFIEDADKLQYTNKLNKAVEKYQEAMYFLDKHCLDQNFYHEEKLKLEKIMADISKTLIAG